MFTRSRPNLPFLAALLTILASPPPPSLAQRVTQMTVEDCRTALAELVTPTSDWFAIDGAAFRHHANCNDAELDPVTSTTLVKRLNHDWEGFCEHTGRYHRGAGRFAIMALTPNAPPADVCAVHRLATNSCPQDRQLQLLCQLLAKRSAYLLKQLDPPFPCAAELVREGRLEDVYSLTDGASVTLVTLRFEGGRHTFGRKVVGDTGIDTINGTPSYGMNGDWPQRNVIHATLKLPDKTEVQLDATGMYDPGTPDRPFRIERSGPGRSWILKARLGQTSPYEVEWMIRDGRSARTSIRRALFKRPPPDQVPDSAQLQADLPPELEKCSIKGSSAWDYDGAGLDVIVRLHCPANDATQVVLRYAPDGAAWTPLPRADSFAPPTPVVARGTPSMVPVRQQPTAPVVAREHYPPAAVQRKLMGDGSPPPASQSLAAERVIDRSNVSKFTAQLGPSLSWIVENGARLKVAKYRRVSLPYAMLAATEKYASGVSMQPGSYGTAGYVAGLPFPQIAADDLDKATKLILNFYAATATDDLDVGPVSCDTGALAEGAVALQAERPFLLDRFLRLSFTGRLEVEPRPKIEPNRDSARYKEALVPLIEPFDLKGTGMVTHRYLDPLRVDDTWLYLPQLRRVRRLAQWQRSEPLFGQEIDPDSYGGFSGNPAAFEWRLAAELTTVASHHDERSNDKPEYFPTTTTWEPRNVWVLEARPKDPQYAYSKRILYLDQESYRVVRADLYDKDGQLRRGNVNSFRFPDASPKEGAVSFAQDAGTQPSMTIVDVQNRRAMSCVLGPRSADRGGWYGYKRGGWDINKGDFGTVNEDSFSLTQHLGGR